MDAFLWIDDGAIHRRRVSGTTAAYLWNINAETRIHSRGERDTSVALMCNGAIHVKRVRGRTVAYLWNVNGETRIHIRKERHFCRVSDVQWSDPHKRYNSRVSVEWRDNYSAEYCR